MTADFPDRTQISHRPRATARVLWASCLSLFLYAAFFHHMVREQLAWMTEKQGAMESIKVVAVPGSAFLRSLGSLTAFNGSLFYLFILGTALLAYLLLSLLFSSPFKRGVFLCACFLALVILVAGDRVGPSFLLVVGLSFVSFYLVTLPSRVLFAPKEVLACLLVMALVSLSLFWGEKHRFFVKARDMFLFDTSLGNSLVSFYYQYSPLAASLVSLEEGIYQGLLFDEEIKDDKVHYLGNGIFVAGAPKIKGYADFKITREEGGISLTGRDGDKVMLSAISLLEVERGMKALFGMKGSVQLSRVGLYGLPAGMFIILMMGVRRVSENRKLFLGILLALGFFLILTIGYVSLTGNRPPEADRLDPSDVGSHGLSAAYYLFEKRKVPETYLPAIQAMIYSESAALRYWGTTLLGLLGDPREAAKLIPLLEDEVPNVRYTSAQALYRLLKNKSFKVLLPRLLSDPNWYVRCKVYSLFLEAGKIPSPV